MGSSLTYSRYAPHRVVDSMVKMNKFLYRVLDFVKTECLNVMLLGDKNIFRIMTYVMQVDGDKLREHTKENNKAKTGNYYYSQQKLGGGNRSHSQQNFAIQPLHQLVFRPSRTCMIRRLEKQALSLTKESQAQRLTPLS